MALNMTGELFSSFILSVTLDVTEKLTNSQELTASDVAALQMHLEIVIKNAEARVNQAKVCSSCAK